MSEIEKELVEFYARADGERCERVVLLARYAAGDLADDEAAEFEQHLGDCAECQADELPACEVD